MPTKKPRIVIVGAGMAGITAANKLYKSAAGSKELFDLSVVEGGSRIGGRINTSEFGGDRIEMGATWIHGIKGSPIHQIAQEINALESQQPWECMDSVPDEPLTIAEGGYELNPSFLEPISSLFKKLMDFSQGKVIEDPSGIEMVSCFKLAAKSYGPGNLSIRSFLRKGLDTYWSSMNNQKEVKMFGNWSRKALEEAIFAMHENTQRTYTSAGDLDNLDYNAESEYIMFPGEEVTIAKGYLSIIESLASVLPPDLIQLGRKVTKIEWQPDNNLPTAAENGHTTRPVKLHFLDGSTLSADHVILTVSLGVLKQGIREDPGMFSPPLPSFKTEAIAKLGYGVVNKLFLQLSNDQEGKNCIKFPSLQMVFHQSEPALRNPKIPWWMRRTVSLSPIYSKSNVLLSWFAGEEALELESLTNEDILEGVSATISNFLSKSNDYNVNSYSSQLCNGDANSAENSSGRRCLKFAKVLKSRWGNDPLFLGSYSYVAVGSSGDDLDTMAEPLPRFSNSSVVSSPSPPLQILFAGEATHRTHYSTTHGAYFSGLREANRLLQHYNRSNI